MQMLSLEFGDLATASPDQLLCESPITTQPFIHLGDSEYAIPILGLPNSFFLDIAENLLQNDKALFEKYSTRRSKFLEAEIVSILKTCLPDARIESCVKWTDPTSGKTFESDVLALIGSFAIIVEAKSHRVSRSARRGSDIRLDRELERLVDAPAEQAERLAKLLESTDTQIPMTNERDQEIQIDASKIKRVICISVTLDTIPLPSLCWKTISKATSIKDNRRPTITISLSDLIVVAEVLNSTSDILHYLWRRSEWEERVEYFGDEEDILVYYLSNGLTPKKSPPDSPQPKIRLHGLSDELRRYFMAEWVGLDPLPAKPKRILTNWWKNLVARVQKASHAEKWDILCSLLDVSFVDQQRMERELSKVVSQVKLRGNEHTEDSVLFDGCANTESDCAIVLFAYRELPNFDKHHRTKNLMFQAEEKLGVKNVLVLGFDVDDLVVPYSMLAYSQPRSQGGST
ncbi:MAG: hypothetical protein U0903_06730 [Planctomycetales bacterium]